MLRTTPSCKHTRTQYKSVAQQYHSRTEFCVIPCLLLFKARRYHGYARVPVATNEPIWDYPLNSKQRNSLLGMHTAMYSFVFALKYSLRDTETVNTMKSKQIEVPIIIGSKEIKTGFLINYYGHTHNHSAHAHAPHYTDKHDRLFRQFWRHDYSSPTQTQTWYLP